MQTVFTLLILFLIAIFSVLLYLRGKTSRLEKLQNGICPDCGAEPKVFIDKETNTKFTNNPIKARLLKNHGCSGASDVEYKCTNCDLKEVHSQANNGCGF